MARKIIRWNFDFPVPIADLRTNRVAVRGKICTDLVGIDGRFTGELRRFPGLQRLDCTGNGDYLIPAVSAAGQAVTLFKCVEIQKGTSNHSLRGFVVRYGGTVLFHYYDTEWGNWHDYTIDSSVPLDVTVDADNDGRYLYYARRGARGYTIFWLEGAPGLYHVEPANPRSMSFGLELPTRQFLYANLVPDTADDVDPNKGALGLHSTLALTQAFQSPGGLLVGNYLEAYEVTGTWYLDVDHRIGIRVGDSRRGVWSELVEGHLTAQIDLGAVEPVAAIPYWGNLMYWFPPGFDLSECDTFEVYLSLNRSENLYRTVYFHAPTEMSRDGATLADLFWRAEHVSSGDYLLPDNISRTVLRLIFGLAASGSYGGMGDWDPLGDFQIADGIGTSDLVFGTPYDEVLDPGGDVARGGLVVASGGVILKPIDPATNPTHPKGEVRWSRLASTPYPESMPPLNTYRPDSPSDDPLALVAAGDAFFVMSPSNVYRFMRVGNEMVSQRVQQDFGLVARDAVSPSGNQLFYMGDSTLVLLDTSTGTATTVGAVERFLIDPDKWAASRSSIKMVYDEPLGALFIINTEAEEALVLWSTTNSVTRLANVHVSAVAHGPHPVLGGKARAWFIDDYGRVLFTDSHRETPGPTMAGLSPGDLGILNGRFAAAVVTNGYTLADLGLSGTGAFSTGFDSGFGWDGSYLVGCHIWLIGPSATDSDPYLVRSVEITGFSAGALVVDASGDYTVTDNTYWAIDPVPMEVQTPRLPISFDPDSQLVDVDSTEGFFRRVVERMFVAMHGAPSGFSGGFDRGFGGPDDNFDLLLGVRRDQEDEVVGQDKVKVHNRPYHCQAVVEAAGQSVFPVIRNYTAGLDLSVLGLQVIGRVESNVLPED